MTTHIIFLFSATIQDAKRTNRGCKQGPTLLSFTIIRDFNCPFTCYKTFLNTKALCNLHLYLLSILTKTFCTITPFFPNINVSYFSFSQILYVIKAYATIISLRDWANSSTGSGEVCAARAGDLGTANALAFQVSFRNPQRGCSRTPKSKI